LPFIASTSFTKFIRRAWGEQGDSVIA